MSEPLTRIRLRLTLWYVGVLVTLLALLGGGLFLGVRRAASRELDRSLDAATQAVVAAARIRAAEQSRATGLIADAVDELRIPDRSLFLLGADGSPVRPARVPDWIAAAAREAGRAGQADRRFETPGDRVVRLHAVRFTDDRGGVYVAAAVANRLELEDQYASLIHASALAVLVALLVAAGGGYLLVHQATAPIARSMQEMRRFMADAAHELRTPITILRARAEIAGGEPRDPARDTATLRAIERETARLGVIVGDLLTLARADAGERPLAREPLYLDDVAAAAADGIRTLAQPKGVRVAVGAFEEATIQGDGPLLRQLLLIVLDNAVKFTPPGGEVRLDVAAAGGRATVTVTDSGIGIAPEQLPHVFERFYRGEQARRSADGAGLGLSIARWIAELHGATIDIASQPGAGTRVTLSFSTYGPGRESPRGASEPRTA